MLSVRSTTLALLATLATGGCASVAPTGSGVDPLPAGERPGSEPPARVESLMQRLERELQTERDRVQSFGDLPDAADIGVPAARDGTDVTGPATDAIRAEGMDEHGDIGPASGSPGVVSERARLERRDAFNPYVLTAHRQNFILPAYGTTSLNERVYDENGIGYQGLQPVELRFQISLKAQLNGRDLMLKDDSLWFGLTLAAWWQVYNGDDSRPFRETNYTPEFFYLKPLLWGPFGGSTTLLLGLVHESNGQQVGLSRSWNRVYAGLVYERGDFALRVRPWYRIPEDAKKTPDDPDGDDNPDILDFLGHGDLGLYWRDESQEYGALLRANTDTGKGALRLSYTFPFNDRFRGLVEYFVGYGDSLIDYDHFQQRLGIGVALTDLI